MGENKKETQITFEIPIEKVEVKGDDIIITFQQGV